MSKEETCDQCWIIISNKNKARPILGAHSCVHISSFCSVTNGEKVMDFSAPPPYICAHNKPIKINYE